MCVNILHWNLHGLNEKEILKVLREKGLKGKVKFYKMKIASEKMI